MNREFRDYVERNTATFTLAVVWLILTGLCFVVYFFSQDMISDSVKDFPKIVFDMWKFVTGGVVSVLSAQIGRGTKHKGENESSEKQGP
jgi:hypothetical protein